MPLRKFPKFMVPFKDSRLPAILQVLLSNYEAHAALICHCCTGNTYTILYSIQAETVALPFCSLKQNLSFSGHLEVFKGIPNFIRIHTHEETLLMPLKCYIC